MQQYPLSDTTQPTSSVFRRSHTFHTFLKRIEHAEARVTGSYSMEREPVTDHYLPGVLAPQQAWFVGDQTYRQQETNPVVVGARCLGYPVSAPQKCGGPKKDQHGKVFAEGVLQKEASNARM